MQKHAVITYHKEFFSVLVKFGVPAVVEMLLTNLGVLVLGMFVGKCDVNDMFASYSLAYNVFNALQAIFNGLFIGITVVLVRHSYREHDRHNNVALSYILCISAFSGIICAIFAIFSRGVIGLFYSSAEAHVFDGAVDMFPAFCLMLFLHLVILAFNACYRGVGNFKVPTVAMILMSGLNVIFGAYFVMYLKMGVKGICLTVILSRVIPLLYHIVVYIIGKQGLKPAGLHHRDFKETGDSLIIGSMAFLEQTGIQIAYLILQSILVTVGTATLAGYQAANSVVNFIYMISGGLNVALVTACGNYYAERKLRKTKACAWYFVLATYITAGSAGVICMLFPKQVMSLFLNAGDSYDMAVKILPYLAATLFITSFFQVIPGLFKAIGDTRITFIIAVFCAICIRLPFAYLYIIKLNLGYIGIVLALTTDYIVRSGWYLYKTYKLFRNTKKLQHS